MDALRELAASKTSPIRTVFFDGVTSYMIPEFAYKVEAALPIRARGLFEKGGQIVARGYDKFFNVNEVPSTQWDTLARDTKGPYFATLKSNGCIIFVSYDDSSTSGGLRVSSKHSMTSQHAVCGRSWVYRHLVSTRGGATVADLAAALKMRNATAVFELCDDEFEEHVISYRGESAGLYMHGLVKNTEAFESYGIDDVKQFALLFGFHVTPYCVYSTLREVKQACDDYHGPPIEGWVIRAGNTFFKYKYEEPYLMWREWREITKKYLNHGIATSITTTYEESVRYCNWVRLSIIKDPHLFAHYLANQGILATRHRYYRETQTGTGTGTGTGTETETETGMAAAGTGTGTGTGTAAIETAERRLLVVMVGAPGVGKSTVGRVLADLLRGTLVENDCLARTERFENAVANALIYNRVAIADRNNHLASDRKRLVDTCQCLFRNLHIWYICWDLPDNKNKHLQSQYGNVLCTRIAGRNDNHPTSATRDRASVYRLLHQRSPMTDEEAVDKDKTHRANVFLSHGIAKTIDHISRQVPLYQWLTECAVARSCAFLYDHVRKRKDTAIAIIQLTINKDQIADILDAKDANMTKTPHRHHITLYYGAVDTQLYRQWSEVMCAEWTIELGSVCFDDDIMAAVVVTTLPFSCTNAVPHVTIAMRQDVSPATSNTMLLPGKHCAVKLINKKVIAHGPKIIYR